MAGGGFEYCKLKNQDFDSMSVIIDAFLGYFVALKDILEVQTFL